VENGLKSGKINGLAAFYQSHHTKVSE